MKAICCIPHFIPSMPTDDWTAFCNKRIINPLNRISVYDIFSFIFKDIFDIIAMFDNSCR